MATIGGQPFIGIRGVIPVAQWQVQDITAPGSIGVTYRFDGFRGESRVIEAWRDYANGTLASQILTYKSLASQIVQIEDNHGLQWNLMLIENVRIVRVQAALAVVGAIGASPDGVIEVAFQVRPTATVY